MGHESNTFTERTYIHLFDRQVTPLVVLVDSTSLSAAVAGSSPGSVRRALTTTLWDVTQGVETVGLPPPGLCSEKAGSATLR